MLSFFYKRESRLFSLGIGIFFFCLIALTLGSLGLLSRHFCLIFLLALNVAGWREWKELIEKAADGILFWKETGMASKALSSLFLMLFVLNLMHAFLPPLDYDVLEYHLGAPSEYHKAGKIFFLANNVYANFPQNLEMIAFFCMTLAGKIYGASIAHVVLCFLGLSLMSAIYYLAENFFSQEEAFLSALFVYFLPWTGDLQRIYYVEIPQAFFLVLALALLYKSNTPKKYFLSGIMIGISAGFKYTSLFLGCMAFIPCILCVSGGYQSKIKAALCMAIGFLLAFSPWAVRNYINTGNPLYPLWNSWIIPGYWTAWMYERFVYAHSARNLYLSGMLATLGETFLWGRYASLVHIFLFIPALIIFAQKIRAIMFFMIVWIALWLGFTHQIDRFVYIVLVLACIPMGSAFKQFLESCSSKISLVFVFSLLSITLYHQAYLTVPEAYDFFLGMKSREDVLQAHYPPYQAEEFLQKNIQGKLLLLGESRVFSLDHPLVSGTVFDQNYLEHLFLELQDHHKIALSLKEQEIDYLYINWNELNRLQSTYSFPFAGKKLPGYFWVSHEELERFLKKYAKRIFHDPKAKIEIYQL